MADFIQDRTGADEYEIVPATDYPTDYQSTTEIAQAEQNEDARPAIANPLPDVADTTPSSSGRRSGGASTR